MAEKYTINPTSRSFYEITEKGEEYRDQIRADEIEQRIKEAIQSLEVPKSNSNMDFSDKIFFIVEYTVIDCIGPRSAEVATRMEDRTDAENILRILELRFNQEHPHEISSHVTEKEPSLIARIFRKFHKRS